MNVKFIAVLLSFFVISTPLHAAPSKTPEQPPVVKHQIDLNKADVSTLTGSFKGIGKKRAEAIIAYRDSHNGIKSIEEFADVKGLGQRFVDKNHEQLVETYTVK
jgi:competence protein ComEA